MVHFASSLLVAVALFSHGALSAPAPDSAINEPGVIAPNGTPITLSSPGPKPTPTIMMEDPASSSMKESPTPVKYGSGNNGYNTGYNDCVQKCMATFGSPMMWNTATSSGESTQTMPTTTTPTPTGIMGSGGGVTHTVIVAPTKGVLRFVPFAVNASVGDTIHYVWGAGPHTVTKSSILEPCNKSSDPGFFNSGPRNATATFDEVVNDTNPLFFYCNVPGHCAKGMFGIINPPSAPITTSMTTVSAMMPSMVTNSTSLAAMLAYTNNATMGTSAYHWGGNMDMANVPLSAREEFVMNIMYSRLVFAANPGMLEAGRGASTANGATMVVPADITTAMGGGGGGTTYPTDSAPANVNGSGTPTGTGSMPTSTPTKSNGASSLVSSTLLTVLIVLITTWFAM